MKGALHRLAALPPGQPGQRKRQAQPPSLSRCESGWTAMPAAPGRSGAWDFPRAYVLAGSEQEAGFRRVQAQAQIPERGPLPRARGQELSLRRDQAGKGARFRLQRNDPQPAHLKRMPPRHPHPPAMTCPREEITMHPPGRRASPFEGLRPLRPGLPTAPGPKAGGRPRRPYAARTTS